jgi:hypothetical protein
MVRRSLVATAIGLILVTLAAGPVQAAPKDGGPYRLTANSTGTRYAPTYTGNGYLGVRVPASGHRGRVVDELRLAAIHARYVRPRIVAAPHSAIPILDELRVTGGPA